MHFRKDDRVRTGGMLLAEGAGEGPGCLAAFRRHLPWLRLRTGRLQGSAGSVCCLNVRLQHQARVQAPRKIHVQCLCSRLYRY